MRRCDKSPTADTSRQRFSGVVLLRRLLLLGLAAAALSGCNRMVAPRSTQAVKDADARAADGDFLHAINLYESALDGSAGSADVHYRLAILYDDKMKDPLSALHHFKRYLTLAPGGARAADVKEFMKRDELALVTSMSGDSVVTRAEAARLKNENLNLRKELADHSARALAAGSDKGSTRAARPEKAAVSKKAKGPPRSHVVQPGDTLFSLSRLYYNSPDRWKDILDANTKNIDDPGKLKIGQTLTIP